MSELEATIADLRIAVSLTTEPGECLEVPRERVTELLDEVERLRAARAVAQWWANPNTADPDELTALLITLARAYGMGS